MAFSLSSSGGEGREEEAVFPGGSWGEIPLSTEHALRPRTDQMEGSSPHKH